MAQTKQNDGSHVGVQRLVLTPSLADSISEMDQHTDGWPWYWFSYGEKCYVFAVASAFPQHEGDEFPRPGSQLQPYETDARVWIGENGTAMLLDQTIASIEKQNGDSICQFIAEAHAALCGKSISAAIERDGRVRA